MKTATRVLDSFAVIAYFEEEPARDRMIEILNVAQSSGTKLLLCTVNWGEVYYSTLRGAGQSGAEQVASLISMFPIEIVPADLELARQAALFKATKKMSYADCFAAALAKLHKAELVTGDKEFKQVESEVKVVWI